jgi:hypothetical protein
MIKPILLLFGELVTTTVVAQNGTSYSTPAPVRPATSQNGVVQTQDNGVVLQELSPPQRAGRRGGVYITGAPPSPAATNMPTPPPPVYVATTNVPSTNAVGATGSSTLTNIGTGTSAETQAVIEAEAEPPGIFVPTFNQPGLPGAVAGRGRMFPNNNVNPRTAPPRDPNAPAIPALGAPAGTLNPALPPPGIATPPASQGTIPPEGRVAAPPRSTPRPPPPISGPAR